MNPGRTHEVDVIPPAKPERTSRTSPRGRASSMSPSSLTCTPAASSAGASLRRCEATLPGMPYINHIRSCSTRADDSPQRSR
jgi:hypothetical protein